MRAESNPGAEGITWGEDDPEMCGGGGVAPERRGGGEGADCGRMSRCEDSARILCHAVVGSANGKNEHFF